MYLQQKQSKQKQSGFVLILALVLLAVMTLAGVGSMNSSNIELKATANARQHNVAFNAAQSVLEFAVSGATNLDFQNTADQVVDTSAVATALPNVGTLSGTSVHAGCSVGVGSSLVAGKGLSYNFFEIRGTGSNGTNTATSIQGQGLRYPAAAC